LNQLVKLKEFRATRKRNDTASFDWNISKITDVTGTLARVSFRSKGFKVNLSGNAFCTFGKYFNIRFKGTDEIRPYSCTLSQTQEHFEVKQRLIARFAADNAWLKLHSREVTIQDTKLLEQMAGTLETEENAKEVQIVKIKDGENGGKFARLQILGEALTLVIKQGKGKCTSKIFNQPLNLNNYDIRGPFGSGLGISRFASGKIVCIGQGTGCNPFLDLLDFITRYYIYMYPLHNGTGVPDPLLDPFKDDFKFTFNNNLTFSFVLCFKNKKDFEEFYLTDLSIISQMEAKVGIKLVNRIMVYISNLDSMYPQKYPEIEFTTIKLDLKAINDLFGKLGVTKDNVSESLEKVILCGKRPFVNDMRNCLKHWNIEENKLNVL
jgi:hypothetical protein